MLNFECMLWATTFYSLIPHQFSKEPTQEKNVMMVQLP
jgi:DNA polymerase IIIc chi subunit